MVGVSAPLGAQDMQPFIDGATQAQVIIGTSRIEAHRLRQAQRRHRGRSAATPAQVRACAGKSGFLAQFGADHPKVQQLYRLCAGVGL
jgi:hypothetical protein